MRVFWVSLVLYGVFVKRPPSELIHHCQIPHFYCCRNTRPRLNPRNYCKSIPVECQRPSFWETVCLSRPANGSWISCFSRVDCCVGRASGTGSYIGKSALLVSVNHSRLVRFNTRGNNRDISCVVTQKVPLFNANYLKMYRIYPSQTW